MSGEKLVDTRDVIIDAAQHLLFKQGYSGTSLNEVMKATDLSKGAFFHHFKSKEELAYAVLEHWADGDDELVKTFVERAQTLADNPLQEATLLIKMFEEWLASLDKPLDGCLFASFTYESARFAPQMHDYIRDRLKIWMGLFEGTFERLVAAYKPVSDHVTAQSLTEMMATTFEGGVLLSRALDDPTFLSRQFAALRHNLQLMFDQN